MFECLVIGSGTIRQCGLIRGSVSLWGFKVSMFKLHPVCHPGFLWMTVLSWLPSDQDIEHSNDGGLACEVSEGCRLPDPACEETVGVCSAGAKELVD